MTTICKVPKLRGFFSVGKDAELVTSPTSTALIKGEVNLLRYFSRRFDLFNITDPIGQAQADATVDSFYAELNWGTGNLSRLVGSTLEPALKQSPYLCKSGLSIADVYAFALLAQDKNGKKSPAVQDWMKRCDQAIQKCQGKTLFSFETLVRLKLYCYFQVKMGASSTI